MRIVRYQKNEKIFYGVLQGEEIRTIEGDIFEEFVVRPEGVNRREVNLISPVNPQI